MIVVEGIDNSGKSTLCRQLSAVLPSWQVQVSEGPPKFVGEMNVRVKSYLSQPSNTIYDRHPCISQPIYGTMRTHVDLIDDDLIKSFYDMRPILIYCDARDRTMIGHVERPEVDTPAHVGAVTQNFNRLLMYYREWAIDHATIIYRIGDPMKRIVRMIETLGAK